MDRPTLALTVGDPAGIGPEIVRACLDRADLRSAMRIVILGPACERPPSVPLATGSAAGSGDVLWWTTPGEGDWEPGRPQASAGRAALAALARGAELARRGAVDALVTAPVSKEALHLAGERVEGQTEVLGRLAGVRRIEMLACVRDLRVALLTRHVPLREALLAITFDGVVDGLTFLASELERLGWERPRLALAGLNPHAGEGGLFGNDELDVLAPAVDRARQGGVEVTGPWPADSVFVRAAAGEFDAVLALYHDQAFLPVKLLAPGEATTLLLGLPYVRVSPAHGTAFDIAGKGAADPTNLALALHEAVRWVQRSRT